jgi:hypothetical protein
MRHAEPGRTEDESHELSLLRCKELARHAIDRLGMEDASRLSPRDRARLASAAAMLKEICEGLQRHSARKGTHDPNTEPDARNHPPDKARLPG